MNGEKDRGNWREEIQEYMVCERVANLLQGGVGNRATSRSKYGTKKPKAAAA